MKRTSCDWILTTVTLCRDWKWGSLYVIVGEKTSPAECWIAGIGETEWQEDGRGFVCVFEWDGQQRYSSPKRSKGGFECGCGIGSGLVSLPITVNSFTNFDLQ